jgi:hypothetical protein
MMHSLKPSLNGSIHSWYHTHLPSANVIAYTCAEIFRLPALRSIGARPVYTGTGLVGATDGSFADAGGLGRG